jgi:hypothetical protein
MGFLNGLFGASLIFLAVRQAKIFDRTRIDKLPLKSYQPPRPVCC